MGAVKVVALVPAYRSADTVAATVGALLSLPRVTRVVVIDDGSDDDTYEAALAAGAMVVRLPANRGKGAALAAGLAAAPGAEVYLLVDADLGATASEADRLLDPIIDDRADLAVGSFQRENSSAGFGMVKGLARRLVSRSGQDCTEPLSGQRAIRGELLASLDLAPGFGLEVGMSMDVVAGGGRLVEVPVGMTHRRTGRDMRGVIHRARQGLDLLRAAWSRVIPPTVRTLGLVGLLGVVIAGAVFISGRRETTGVPVAPSAARRVIVVGVPRLGTDALDPAVMPQLWSMGQRGGVGVITPRTPASAPSSLQAWATLGAGAPTLLGETSSGSDTSATPEQVTVVPGGDHVDGGTAAQASARATGTRPTGAFVALGAVLRRGDLRSYGNPGQLGDTIRRSGGRLSVVSTEFLTGIPTDTTTSATAAVAAMGSDRSLDAATTGPSLLVPDPSAPDGYRTDADRLLAAVDSSPPTGLVVVGLGDPDRAAAAADRSEPNAGAALRRRTEISTDRLIGRLASLADDTTTVIVVGITPPGSDWSLTPLVMAGAGVRPGTLFSESTRRQGLLTLTDVSPTVTRLLGTATPTQFVGHPAARSDEQNGIAADVAAMKELDVRATSRESIYVGVIVAFVIGQALIYGAIALLFRRVAHTRWSRFLEGCGIGSAAWPLATFVARAGPVELAKPAATIAFLIVFCVAVGWIGTRMRTTPLGPLNAICAITLGLLTIDLATGGHLQESSIIGYSPLFAARFYGIGNMAYSVLASTAIILALRVSEGRWTLAQRAIRVAAVLGFALLVDILPGLGADVGGLIALVPTFAVIGVGLVGVRWTRRTVLWTAVAVAVGGAAMLALAATGETHLTKFLSGDSASIVETIQRKLETNIRVLGLTTWAWMVPIVIIFMVRVLVVGKAGRWVFGARRDVRLAFAGILAVGVVGALVNDSGVVITAISFIYVGAMLALLVLRQPYAPPEVLEPSVGPAVGAASP